MRSSETQGNLTTSSTSLAQRAGRHESRHRQAPLFVSSASNFNIFTCGCFRTAPHHDAWPPHKLVKSSISPDTNVHAPSDKRKQTRAALYECRKNEEGAKKNRAERKEDGGDNMGSCAKNPKSRTKQKPAAVKCVVLPSARSSAPPA